MKRDFNRLLSLSEQLTNKDHPYHMPSFKEEHHEIQDRAKDLGVHPSHLTKNGKLVALNDSTWSKIDNTDSYDTDTIGKAKKLANEYGKDINSVIQAYKKKESLPAPIVYTRKDGSHYLVAGNTRLMAARALGVTPTVLMTGHHQIK